MTERNDEQQQKLDHALVESVRAHDADAAQGLLDRGARPEAHGNMPLIIAVLSGQEKVVEALLEAGARSVYTDGEGRELDLVVDAYRAKQWSVAEILIRHGADPCLRQGVVTCNILEDVPLEKLKVFAAPSVARERMETVNRQGDALFLILLAAAKKREDVLDWFLSQRHLNESTARRVFVQAHYGGSGFLSLLKKHGIFFHDDEEYGTPLLRMVEQGHMAAASELIDLGADVNHARPTYPLTAAVYADNAAMAEMLLQRGADIFAQDAGAVTLAQSRSSAVAEVLQRGLDAQRGSQADRFENMFGPISASGASEKALSTVHLPFEESGVLIAVKAGKFEELIGQMRVRGLVFDHPDFLKALAGPDDHGSSVIGLLAQAGKLEMLADHRLWTDPEKSLRALFSFVPAPALPQFRRKVDETLARRRADADIAVLRRKAGGKDRFKL